MFGRKQKCPRCGEKSSVKYNFCPFCGHNFKSEEFFEPSFKMGFPFNAIFKQLEKQIEKEFREMDASFPTFDEKAEKRGKMPQGISISISSAGNGAPVIRVKNLGENRPVGINEISEIKRAPKEQMQLPKITQAQAEKYSKLPKQEPLTSVRRLTDKIVYEIDLPDVDEKNLIITRLHNSIEIKAFAKDKAFFKLLPISLPIMKSELKDGKLVLELKPAQ